MPLSIVVLQALDSGPRADTILERLQLQVEPAERQVFGAQSAVRLPCRLLPDEARADVEHRLQTIDARWRDCIIIRESRPRRPGRFRRSSPFERGFSDR